MQYFKFLCIGLALIVTIVFRQSSTETAPEAKVIEGVGIGAVSSEDITMETVVSEPINEIEKGVILEVIDGQTVRVLFSGKREETIILADIQVPSLENKEPFSEEAKLTLQQILYRDAVAEFEFGSPQRNEMGILIAYIWHDDVFINVHLVEQGLGKVVPNDKSAYQARLYEAQGIAKNDRKNIWSLPQ